MSSEPTKKSAKETMSESKESNEPTGAYLVKSDNSMQGSVQEFKDDPRGAIIYLHLITKFKSNNPNRPGDNIDYWLVENQITKQSIQYAQECIVHRTGKNDVGLEDLLNIFANEYESSRHTKAMEYVLDDFRADPDITDALKVYGEGLEKFKKLSASTEEENLKNFQTELQKAGVSIMTRTKEVIEKRCSYLDPKYIVELAKIAAKVFSGDPNLYTRMYQFYPVFMYEVANGNLWKILLFVLSKISFTRAHEWNTQIEARYREINEQYNKEAREKKN